MGSLINGNARGLDWTATAVAAGKSGTDIGDLGGGVTSAVGLNDNNEVVGLSYNSQNQQEAIAWSPSTAISALQFGGFPAAALAINDVDVIVGIEGSNRQGVNYTPQGHVLFIPGGIPSAISPSNEVVGTTPTFSAAITWTAGGALKTLPAPAGTQSAGAFAVRLSGTVVGYSQGSQSGAVSAACVWTPADQYRDLTSATHGLPAGVVLKLAEAINTSGQIVATGSDGNGYLLTPLGGGSRKGAPLR
jgi:hypothetical protein